MAPTGIPSRKIGTPTTTPGDYALGLGQLPYIWIQPPDPSFDPLTFNFNSDLNKLNTDSALVTYSTSLDIKKFTRRGGKIIWYHGLSDPGPPVIGTIRYYSEMAQQNGGLGDAQKFSRLYLVPNMGHCSGGPATDQFDLLSPLVAWVEHGYGPDEIIASGTNFTSLPTTRSRPLCPYPEEARYIGTPPSGRGSRRRGQLSMHKTASSPNSRRWRAGSPEIITERHSRQRGGALIARARCRSRGPLRERYLNRPFFHNNCRIGGVSRKRVNRRPSEPAAVASAFEGIRRAGKRGETYDLSGDGMSVSGSAP